MIAYTSESAGRPGQRCGELGAERGAGARPAFDEAAARRQAAPPGRRPRGRARTGSSGTLGPGRDRPAAGSPGASSAVTRWMVERMSDARTTRRSTRSRASPPGSKSTSLDHRPTYGASGACACSPTRSVTAVFGVDRRSLEQHLASEQGTVEGAWRQHAPNPTGRRAQGGSDHRTRPPPRAVSGGRSPCSTASGCAAEAPHRHDPDGRPERQQRERDLPAGAVARRQRADEEDRHAREDEPERGLDRQRRPGRPRRRELATRRSRTAPSRRRRSRPR